MHADEILFLDKGRIIERGTHKQLLALKGNYNALHSLQILNKQEVKTPFDRVSFT
jgi:ATP-binding cassette subfamily B protein